MQKSFKIDLHTCALEASHPTELTNITTAIKSIKHLANPTLLPAILLQDMVTLGGVWCRMQMGAQRTVIYCILVSSAISWYFLGNDKGNTRAIPEVIKSIRNYCKIVAKSQVSNQFNEFPPGDFALGILRRHELRQFFTWNSNCFRLGSAQLQLEWVTPHALEWITRHFATHIYK